MVRLKIGLLPDHCPVGRVRYPKIGRVDGARGRCDVGGHGNSFFEFLTYDTNESYDVNTKNRKFVIFDVVYLIDN